MLITDAQLKKNWKKEKKKKIDHQALFIVPKKIKQVYNFSDNYIGIDLGETIIGLVFFKHLSLKIK